MARVISIHEYELKPGTAPEAFERALRDAETSGLFDLPGLIAHHFVKGVKGVRRNAYAAIWIYERYPEPWRVWENRLLAPVLSDHPDAIRFTSYEEL